MPGKIRRGSRSISPMPVCLEVDALLRVSDQGGRIIRTEALPGGTDLRDRLRIAHENYARQGWQVGELRLGQWAIFAEKPSGRLMIAIRDSSSAVASGCLSHRQISQCPRSTGNGPAASVARHPRSHESPGYIANSPPARI
jgi:hypothetical protein